MVAAVRRRRRGLVTPLVALVWILCLLLHGGLGEDPEDAASLVPVRDSGEKVAQRLPRKTKQKKQKKTKPETVALLPPPTFHDPPTVSRRRQWLETLAPNLIASHDVRSRNGHYDPFLGFEMGVLSGLAYWEFHKKPPPHNATGFGLVDKPQRRFSKRKWLRNVLQHSVPLMVGAPGLRRKLRDQQQPPTNTTHHTIPSQSRHKRPVYTHRYSFYNWHEPTGVKGVKFHDTDVLVATCCSDTALVVAFAGTASVADAVTNVQTFEPANHSRFFDAPVSGVGSSRRQRLRDWVWSTLVGGSHNGTQTTTTTTQGSLHRGFLNAYSRVGRGHVLKLDARGDTANDRHPDRASRWQRWRHHVLPSTEARPQQQQQQTPSSSPSILESLDRRFGHCHAARVQDDDNDDNDNNNHHHGDDDDDNDERNLDAEEPVELNGKEQKSTGKQQQQQHEETPFHTETNDAKNPGGAAAAKTAKATRKKKARHKKKTKPPKGCKITEKDHGEEESSLAAILRELVEDALASGHTVHVTGHSLGGALATLLALDVVVGTPHHPPPRRDSIPPQPLPPTDRLFLWTFGAPQVADSLFWESLRKHSPRWRSFVGEAFSPRWWWRQPRPRQTPQHIHRYVTLSDDGRVDAVSEVAKHTLAAHKESRQGGSGSNDDDTVGAPLRNHRPPGVPGAGHPSSSSPQTPKKHLLGGAANLWHGKVAQSLGGVSRGGEVQHCCQAHYLWTPDQHQKQAEREQQQQKRHGQQRSVSGRERTSPEMDAASEEAAASASAATNTRSSMAAHSLGNYLQGISREAGPKHHPLVPNVPEEWLEFLELKTPPKAR